MKRLEKRCYEAFCKRERRAINSGKPKSRAALYQRQPIPVPPPSAGPDPETPPVLGRDFEDPHYFGLPVE